MTEDGAPQGWRVVAAVFVVSLIGFGISYSFGSFFPALEAEFGGSRGDIALIFSVSGFLSFALGSVSGALADRFGPRPVVAAGVVLLALGLALAAQSATLTTIYLGYGIGVGAGVGFSYVPAIATVQRWFVAKRGLATGLAVSGIGAGTLVLPPSCAVLIEAVGWRAAYLVLAAVALIVGLGASFFLRVPPVDACGSRQARRLSREGPDLTTALRSLPFWLIYVGSFLSSLGLYVPFVHIAAYARDHNLPESTGPLLLAMLGVGSLCGRFVLGGIADRLGRVRSLAGMYAGLCGACMLWLFATTVAPLVAFALLFGSFYGGLVALSSALCADYFEGGNGSTIFGAFMTSVALGTLLGPWLAGSAFDLTGSYAIPITVAALTNAVAAIVTLLLESPSSWRARALAAAETAASDL